MSPTMNQIYELMNDKQYHQAIILLEEAEKLSKINSNLLVLKGICLQLDNEESKYSLIDIENMFKDAFKMDRECIESVIELAWFNLNVNDDPHNAMLLFKEAFRSYSLTITDIVIGIAKCLNETHSPQESLAYLELMKTSILDHENIKKAQKQIEETI